MVMSLTQEENTTNILQSDQAEHYLVADVWRLKFEKRDGVSMGTEVGSVQFTLPPDHCI